jgi:hypothetical protein
VFHDLPLHAYKKGYPLEEHPFMIIKESLKPMPPWRKKEYLERSIPTSAIPLFISR